MTKNKAVVLNPEQVDFLMQEMLLLIDAEDFPIEQKLMAADLVKKLKGRPSKGESDE